MSPYRRRSFITLCRQSIVDESGRTVIAFSEAWHWDKKQHNLVASLEDEAFLIIFTQPFPATGFRLIANSYRSEWQKCLHVWESLLQRGVQMDLPEEIVNHAYKALIVGIFSMVKDDLLYYSVGNAYERQYEAECGDALRALLLYGFVDEARRLIVPLLDYTQKGLEFHDAAFKLQMLAHYYWLTRDPDFLQEHRWRWMAEVERIVKSRELKTGLLPRENYCGDIKTQVYSLNSNANAWRGLRDISAVLNEMGEKEIAHHLFAIAHEFREAILKAVEKSERCDCQPPFIPIALFGEEQPYERLTDTVMGSYWCLMAPYVLGSEIFGANSERVGWILDYLHKRGDVCMGMIRFHQHSGLFANENALDDLYGLRYVLALLRRDEVERALVSFYGKLTQGLTRNTFIGAEGTGLVPLDEWGRPMYLPPNSASNALFLWTLRYLLVQDFDIDEDGKPDTLRLLFATPRRWLKDGAMLQVKRMPTAFGEISLLTHSQLHKGRLTVEVVLPEHQPRQTILRIRLPQGWVAETARIGRKTLAVGRDSSIDISNLHGKNKIMVGVRRLVNK